MTFQINIQAGELFDRFSILKVKLEKCTDLQKKEKISLELKDLENAAVKSIGMAKYCEILESAEYIFLLLRNRRTFEFIDEIAPEDIMAKKIDDENFARFQAKKALQERFFNEELKEQKLGYS